MGKLGRLVVAYHPEIRVRCGDRTITIKADMDDYYDDDEVIDKLAAANPSCKTVGDLVKMIESGHFCMECGVINCHVSHSDGVAKSDVGPMRDWDELI